MSAKNTHCYERTHQDIMNDIALGDQCHAQSSTTRQFMSTCLWVLAYLKKSQMKKYSGTIQVFPISCYNQRFC